MLITVLLHFCIHSTSSS